MKLLFYLFIYLVLPVSRRSVNDANLLWVYYPESIYEVFLMNSQFDDSSMNIDRNSNTLKMIYMVFSDAIY